MRIFFSIIFSLAIAVFFGYAVLAVFHALRFKYLSLRSRKITFIFVGASIITVAASISLFMTIDWSFLE